MTTQAAATRRISTLRRETGRYLPRRFNPITRERFLRDRRRRYLARVADSPSELQVTLAQSLAQLEWSALACEADGSLPALRDAREHRRLFQRLFADFEKSLVAPAKPLGVAELLAAIHGTAA